jgi:hypothetical protein
MKNLKELEEEFKKEVSKTEFPFISLYECSVEDGLDAIYYDSDHDEKVGEMCVFAEDFFKKYNIKEVKNYNSGNYGDPYYRVNQIYSVNDDFHYKVTYRYDSYDSNDYDNDLKEVTPVQEVKVRFR